VLCAAVRGKVDIKEERDFLKVVRERAKAREKLLKLYEQVCDMSFPVTKSCTVLDTIMHNSPFTARVCPEDNS
jgi:hypothetical protein